MSSLSHPAHEIPAVDSSSDEEHHPLPGQEQDGDHNAAAAAAATIQQPADPPGIVPQQLQAVLDQLLALNSLVDGLKLELENTKLANANLEAKIEAMTTKSDTDGASMLAGIQRPKPLDRKDVDKPGKYGGNAETWLQWSRTFKKFLRRQDARWTTLLDKIEGKKGVPVTWEDEVLWSEQAQVGDYMAEFKDQLNEYLETYTTGAAKTLVQACGDTKALDAWRQLADRGHSLRVQHVHALRRKAYFPKVVMQLKDVENQINLWEKDVELFTTATGEVFPEPNKKMNLVDMCPERLRSILKEREHRLPTYQDVKTEIADWLADQAHSSKTGRVSALEGPPEDDEAAEVPFDFDPEVATNQELHALVSGPELRALVRNKFAKKGQGKGKRTEGNNEKQADVDMKAPDHSAKECFECGEMGHIGRNCAQRKARVAAGGPERAPKDKKGAKGAPWQPSATQWKSWYPGPSPTQWNSWFKGKGGGKGGFFTGKGQQLQALMQPWSGAPSAVTAENWLQAPGGMLARFSENRPNFEHRNSFTALKDDDQEAPAGSSTASPTSTGSSTTTPTPSPSSSPTQSPSLSSSRSSSTSILSKTSKKPKYAIENVTKVNASKAPRKSWTNSKTGTSSKVPGSSKFEVNHAKAMSLPLGHNASSHSENMFMQSSMCHCQSGPADHEKLIADAEINEVGSICDDMTRDILCGHCNAHFIETIEPESDPTMPECVDSDDEEETRTPYEQLYGHPEDPSESDSEGSREQFAVPADEATRAETLSAEETARMDERSADADRQWEILKSGIPGYAQKQVVAPTWEETRKLMAEDLAKVEKAMLNVAAHREAPPDGSPGLLRAMREKAIEGFKEFPSLAYSTAVAKDKRRAREKIPKQPFTRSPCWAFGGNFMPFTENRSQAAGPSLMPLTRGPGEWEYIEAIVDSGATVTVIPPTCGQDYAIVKGEAAIAGVTYTVANGDDLPNLGEKTLPVMTLEGSMRGLRAQVANVSKPLQAVRSLVRAGHIVVFGGGENGDENYVLNRVSGEINHVRDDGVNYLMGMYVIPKAEMDFTRPAAQP